MDDAVGRLVGGIALAALSAVTFVAYKHPKAYVKLYLILITIVGVGMVGISVWGISNVAALNSLLGITLPNDKSEEIRAAIEGASPPFWWIGVGLMIIGYLWLLTTLPNWLLDPEPPKDQNNQE